MRRKRGDHEGIASDSADYGEALLLQYRDDCATCQRCDNARSGGVSRQTAIPTLDDNRDTLVISRMHENAGARGQGNFVWASIVGILACRRDD